MNEHKYVTHKTYTGPGCAMCGKSEAEHGQPTPESNGEREVFDKKQAERDLLVLKGSSKYLKCGCMVSAGAPNYCPEHDKRCCANGFFGDGHDCEKQPPAPDWAEKEAREWLLPFIEQDHHKTADDVASLAALLRRVVQRQREEDAKLVEEYADYDDSTTRFQILCEQLTKAAAAAIRKRKP